MPVAGPDPSDDVDAHFASDGSDSNAESVWYATYAATAPLVKSPAFISLRSDSAVVTATTTTTVHSVVALNAQFVEKTKRRNAYARHVAANAYAKVVAPSKHAACRNASRDALRDASSFVSFVSFCL